MFDDLDDQMKYDPRLPATWWQRADKLIIIIFSIATVLGSAVATIRFIL